MLILMLMLFYLNPILLSIQREIIAGGMLPLMEQLTGVLTPPLPSPC